MKRIKLTQGKYALVDDEDFEYLNQFKWCFDNGYAIRGTNPGKIWMHRVINKTLNDLETDHINNNRLDNRKLNLRSATHKENCRNQKLHVKKDFKGVVWFNLRSKWKARIIVNGKEIYLGLFDNKKVAALKYNEAAKKYFGIFANFNQI